MTAYSTTTPVPLCDVTVCRIQIQSWLVKGWAYDSTHFGECNGCSQATNPNFPADWSNRWSIMNFFIPNANNTDCTGNPYTGNVASCQKACLTDITCVGFSRAKSASDTDSSAACYLKNNITGTRVFNDTTWQTIVFNSTV